MLEARLQCCWAWLPTAMRFAPQDREPRVLMGLGGLWPSAKRWEALDVVGTTAAVSHGSRLRTVENVI